MSEVPLHLPDLRPGHIQRVYMGLQQHVVQVPVLNFASKNELACSQGDCHMKEPEGDPVTLSCFITPYMYI